MWIVALTFQVIKCLRSVNKTGCKHEAWGKSELPDECVEMNPGNNVNNV